MGRTDFVRCGSVLIDVIAKTSEIGILAVFVGQIDIVIPGVQIFQAKLLCLNQFVELLVCHLHQGLGGQGYLAVHGGKVLG